MIEEVRSFKATCDFPDCGREFENHVGWTIFGEIEDELFSADWMSDAVKPSVIYCDKHPMRFPNPLDSSKDWETAPYYLIVTDDGDAELAMRIDVKRPEGLVL